MILMADKLASNAEASSQSSANPARLTFDLNTNLAGLATFAEQTVSTTNRVASSIEQDAQQYFRHHAKVRD